MQELDRAGVELKKKERKKKNPTVAKDLHTEAFGRSINGCVRAHRSWVAAEPLFPMAYFCPGPLKRE